MINGKLEQFLDTGWWNADATIFYNNHIYFFEGYFDKEHHMYLRILKWKVENINNKSFKNILGPNGDFIDYDCIEMDATNEDELREKFLKSKIWDGKSFWEVEKELTWLD